MRLSASLTESTILCLPGPAGWPSVLRDLIGRLGVDDPAAVGSAIAQRETAGSTLIAPGLAIPHARVADLARLAAALAVCPSGLTHPSGAPVQVCLLFVSSKTQTREHLAFLAGVSALFQTEGLVETLAQCAAPADVLARLREAERGLTP